MNAKKLEEWSVADIQDRIDSFGISSIIDEHNKVLGMIDDLQSTVADLERQLTDLKRR